MKASACILNAALLMSVLGCRPPAVTERSPRTDTSPQSSVQLPPVYPRATITDPEIAEIADEFTAWINQIQNDEKPVFGRIEVLPPVQTLEPYGVGTYERSLRLPVILTTGEGWASLSADYREEITATAFTNLSLSLEAAKTDPPVKATVTIQTPQGLELAWVNRIQKGRRLLHGDGE